MITGRQAFDGDSLGDTVASVLTKTPNWTVLPATTPSTIRTLLRRCLEKDPRRRLDSTAAARFEIEDALTTPLVDAKTVDRDPQRWPVFVPSLLALAFAVVAALALWAIWRQTPSGAHRAVLRLDLDLGVPIATSNLGPDVIVSPDGSRIVVVAQGANGKSRLMTRRLDQPEAVELRGSEGAYAPFFSPDGGSVAFFAGGKLKKVALEGGDPVTLCDAAAGRGGTWAADGNIIAALETQTGLSIVPSEGGRIERLTTLAPGENSHRWPSVLPGAKTVLFTLNTTFSNFDESSIVALSLTDHKSRIILERAGMYPRYVPGVPDGYLIYVTKGTLFAVPFDPDRLEIRGRPAPVVEDVSNDTAFGFARIDLSANGMLIYRKGRTEGLRTIHWMESTGRLDSLDLEPATYQFPRVSPDGSRLIWMMNRGSIADLWIYDWRRGSKSRVTDGKDVYAYPVWSPDGRFVVFSSSKGIMWTRADAGGNPLPLIAGKPLQWPTSFTSDGKRLVFSELTPTGGLIRTVLVDGTSGQLQAGTPETFLQTSALPFSAFSPDGRWLAYADAESGAYEVYVRAFPDKGRRWLVSNGGGTMPLWSRNGRELFYRNENSQIMVATYTITGETFLADKPRVWSEKQLANTGLTPLFDLAPDGKRFAVLMAPEGTAAPDGRRHVTFVTDFLEQLRELAPAKQ